MPYATRSGVRLFYNDTGSDDPPLLFVHGWCCDSTHWRRTVARRKKRALRALVMVDAPLYIAISQPEIDALLQGVDSPAYRQAARMLIDARFFRPTSPKALRAELTERLLRTPQHVLAPALRSLAAEMRPAPLALGIPSLFIDAGRTLEEMHLIEVTVPGIEIGRTVGAGHFNMLEAPDQVNGMLRTFIDQLPSVGAGLQTRARNTT